MKEEEEGVANCNNNEGSVGNSSKAADEHVEDLIETNEAVNEIVEVQLIRNSLKVDDRPPTRLSLLNDDESFISTEFQNLTNTSSSPQPMSISPKYSSNKK